MKKALLSHLLVYQPHVGVLLSNIVCTPIQSPGCPPTENGCCKSEKTGSSFQSVENDLKYNAECYAMWKSPLLKVNANFHSQVGLKMPNWQWQTIICNAVGL